MKAYKSFDSDWKCQGFQYEVGKTYKHKGEIKLCISGFHACKNPIDVFTYYPCVPWGKFAEVELSGEIKGEDDDKQVASKITIVKELSFDEFVELCKKYGISRSRGINLSEGVNSSRGVNLSRGVNRSEGINCSEGINLSDGVNWSAGVNESHGINRSHGINLSDGINESEGVNRSRGVNSSDGVNLSEGIIQSNGIHNSMFVSNIHRKSLLFNKEVTEDRINEVRDKYNSLVGYWHPQFNNLKSLYLKHGSEWKQTPIPKAEELSKKKAWSDMPKVAIDYLRSLPEFDAKIFEEVTGIKIG